MSTPMRVGVIGCGHVSDEYLEQAANYPRQVEVIACAARNRAVAEEKAEKFAIPRAYTPEEMLADPDVELVVNLTTPTAHTEVTMAAIAAGKHVYTEKPFALSLAEADQIVAAAAAAGVQVGCAPATFLSGAFQTARKTIDDGWIGDPVAATAFFTCRGYEYWHPNIDPFYEPGGGPMLDLGPYLVTVLVNLFGPATRVDALTKRVSKTRPRPQGTPRAETGDIEVKVSTHDAGNIEFASGPVATVITSWEMWASRLPYVEIYGTEGSLSVPFVTESGAEPLVRRGEPADLGYVPPEPGGGEWIEIGMTHRADTLRAVALADMADAIRTGRSFRANSEFAYHALEIMLAFDQASRRGEHVTIGSTCERPDPLPTVDAGEPVRL
ncbi:MAG: Gfo/Idh/MocA family oxidoreductase [Actinobacteria bacterium]|nr:Gfo/Idh/MocA family oxidoreductase [Actinomycetota bacterium]